MCTLSCPARLTFPNTATGTCQRCDRTCVACTGPSKTDCTLCYSPKTFLNPITGQCITDCTTYDPNTYGSTLTTKCEKCWSDPTSKCLTCSGGGESQCTSCYTGFILDNGQCLQDANGDGKTDPVVCSSGGAIFNGRCVTTCPSGYYKTIDAKYNRTVCATCDPTCKSCSDVGADHCTSCWGVFTTPIRYLYLETNTSKIGTCVTQCPNGMA